MRDVNVMGQYQQGLSIIALPIIVLVMVALGLLVFKINHALLIKAKLDRLSYSLATVISVEALALPLVTEKQVVTQVLADDLLSLVKRHLALRIKDRNTEIGIELEQLKFIGDKNRQQWHGFQSGAECQAKTGLSLLSDLSPLGTVEGFNVDRRADLFQVTLCLVGVKSVGSALGTMELRDFFDDYYKSSSLLNGRYYD
ncbi:hypothetical protein HQQ94_09265 [Shewanella sp. VB17]|uniref:tight adherence pilus pseudopilin TadF n=1 Tax=Shewanella sp. VB17 TaxID=2739432 RepID=UPI001564AAF6|nr:tight adherence pilus pseudopilin TadF [Shewanella sp. VB17]NRD73430.1 hypothetical protein [Shewanella sp. VB17]